MSLRRILQLCLLMCGGVATAAAPNIVLIVADDLGWAGVGYHNPAILTPNIDGLAEEGVRLERFYVSPICSPTRAGLLTGRWPIRFGIMASQIRPFHDYGIHPEEETLPEMLADAGYERRALVGKWHLGDSRPQFLPRSQGFTSFYGCLGGMVDNWTHANVRDPSKLDWWRDGQTAKEEGHVTDLIAREAVAFIEDRSDEAPFFLMVSFTAPHLPYMPLKEDVERYSHLPVEHRDYAAVVTGMDRGIGEILAALKRSGIRDQTFILFLSDNGDIDEYWNHPFRGEKRLPYEGAIRVPALMHWPDGGISGGRIVSERAGYIDVVPTLRVVAELEQPVAFPLDGISLLEVARGRGALEDRDWYTYVSFRNEMGKVRMALSSDEWKLVYSGPDPLRVEHEKLSQMELFQIDLDPYEERNVLKQNRELARKMYRRLREFRALEPEGAPH